MSRVRLIQKGGKPAFVVVPIDLWERVRGAAEDAEDLLDLERFELADDGFRVPLEVVEAVLAGIHPLRAWREHRGLTQDALAAVAGVSAPYLSQIEGGKRVGAVRTLRRIAAALDVPLDELTRDAWGQA
jgi:DNA-binding XRE family transcriptional regulator